MFEFVSSLSASRTFEYHDEDLFILLKSRDVILFDGKLPERTLLRRSGLPDKKGILLGFLDGVRCFVLETGQIPVGGMWQVVPGRQFLFEFSEAYQMALCRARVLLYWQNQHRYCGNCRNELQLSDHDSGLFCPECGNVYYPQLAPAVIVAVTRNNGKELLLAHNRSFAGEMYSLIAGFVEAGETVEAAIHRELWEECSLRVKNLQYLSSQVWPFPNSLMLAFQAEYDSGTAEPDGGELSDLGWFTAENHPLLPSPGSIARWVIDRIFTQ